MTNADRFVMMRPDNMITTVKGLHGYMELILLRTFSKVNIY